VGKRSGRRAGGAGGRANGGRTGEQTPPKRPPPFTLTNVTPSYVLNDLDNDEGRGDLSQPERFVLQVITKAGNMGIWTKDIRSSTGLPTLTLSKVYKSLESKRLVKTVKSVAAKSKKLYMLFNLQPAKELTGGPWYTEHEFDHEFILELRNVVLTLIEKTGKIGVKSITTALATCGISKIELSEMDVDQLVTTLVLDGEVEEQVGDEDEYVPDGESATEKMFTLSRPKKNIAAAFGFRYFECLAEDFAFRELKFGEYGSISAHEPHHHSN